MRDFQNGFSLFELIVVIALTSLAGVWSASTWVQHAEDVATESMGRWLITIKESVDQMLVRQADFLSGLSSPTASSAVYRDIWRPTLNELLQAGHLASGFSMHAPLGYDLSIRVLKPIGLCLTLGCKIEVLTIATPHSTQLIQAGNVTRLGKMLASLGGHGASVTHLSPQRVRGAIIDLPNPPALDMAVLPVGSIVLHSFYDTSAEVTYLRQGEKRDVQLDANLSLAGTLNAAEGIRTGGGITATGSIASEGHLQLGAIASQSAPCETSGLLAQSNAGGLLICQQGVWQTSTKSGGGLYIDRAGFGCEVRDELDIDRRNPMTGDCSCPSGFKPLLVSVWRYPHHSFNEFYTYMCLN